MAWMVVRVRGSIHAREDIVDTLRFLHLSRPNHVTVIPEEPSFRGMLSKVQGYVTWGEADPETVGLLLTRRGETADGKRVSTESLPQAGPAKDLDELAKTVTERGLPRMPGLKPLFRLRAPTGGWRSTKKPFALGGALGYRGRTVNDLVRRMM
jgi:large subunit ribosomal protein L30